MSGLKSVQYALEFGAYYPKFVRQIDSLDLGPPARELVQGRHTANVGCSIITGAIYDMHVGADRQIPSRERAKFLGGLSMWYFDLVDEVIDSPDRQFDETTKQNYLYYVARIAQGCAPESPQLPIVDRKLEASVDIAAQVSSLIGSKPDAQIYREAIREVLPLEQNHSNLRSSDELLQYGVELGRICGKLLGGVVDYVEGGATEPILRASESIGIYGTLFDHLYELDEDLINEAMTYPTALIGEKGDEPAVRQELKECILSVADDYRVWGRANLTPRQTHIYEGLIRLLDVRYRIIAQARSRLKNRNAAPITPALVE